MHVTTMGEYEEVIPERHLWCSGVAKGEIKWAWPVQLSIEPSQISYIDIIYMHVIAHAHKSAITHGSATKVAEILESLL